MPHNRSLTFKIANRNDFTLLNGILFALSLICALLSPQPVFLTILVLLLFVTGWFAYILDIPKVNNVISMLILFPDGRVRIELDNKLNTEGFVSGQQWCSQHVAVLRYITGGKRRQLVLLSAHQNADEYRRLNVWLRQDFCNDTGKKQVPAS